MMKGEKYLGKLVVARTKLGAFQFVGRCVSYTDAPTVQVVLPNGQRASWRADLVDVVEIPAEAIGKLIPEGQ